MARIRRPVLLYFALLFGTIALGLATRRIPAAFPAVVAEYGGDTLWAAMVFWAIALIWRNARSRNLALAALAVSCTVEVSQLYHAPWIDAVRGTRLGALALGYGFLWSDIACYVVGVLIAASIDTIVRRRTVKEDPARRTR